jgi:hypothetical protein
MTKYDLTGRDCSVIITKLYDDYVDKTTIQR